MPSPKSGKAGSPIPPAEPDVAEEADQANPGEVESIKAAQRQSGSGKYAPVLIKGPPPPESAEEAAKKKSWIEIVLVDKNNKPVPGEPYIITLPDGTNSITGTLDQEGFARVDGIDPGTCKVTFPRLDKDTWKPK